MATRRLRLALGGLHGNLLVGRAGVTHSVAASTDAEFHLVFDVARKLFDFVGFTNHVEREHIFVGFIHFGFQSHGQGEQLRAVVRDLLLPLGIGSFEVLLFRLLLVQLHLVILVWQAVCLGHQVWLVGILGRTRR